MTTVSFRELPDGGGRIATYRGTADSRGVGFYIAGLSINAPLGILLVSGDEASPMKLAVKNDLSPGWDKRYDADADGVVKAQLRTEGPAFALVTSSEERNPYFLAIWLGPEVKLHKLLDPPFVSQAEYQRRHGALRKRPWLWVGLGTALLIAGLLRFSRWRGRSIKATFLLAVSILTAGGSSAGADGTAINWNLDFSASALGTPTRENIEAFRETVSDPPRDLRPGTAAETSYTTVLEWSQFGTQLASGTSTGLNAYQRLRGAWEAMSDLDAELSRRQQDDGSGPQIPSSCAGGEGEENAGTCGACFAKAYGELNFTRLTLERLRTIHRRTIAFIIRSEAFGDSVSGIHGVSGLSWQYSKMGNEQERTRFNRTSHEKYEALIRNMRRSLGMVAACEARHFDNPDWYNRYGFMYFNFVKDAYAPSE